MKNIWKLSVVFAVLVVGYFARGPIVKLLSSEFNQEEPVEEAVEEVYVEPEEELALATDGPMIYKKIRWDVLAELDLKTGKKSKKLSELIGKKVRIPGFVVPLEISDKLTKDFLLVPTAGACYHVPPPPANQMIYVTLKDGGVPAQEKRAPIWVYGILSASKQKTEWGNVGFSLDGDDIEPFTGGY